MNQVKLNKQSNPSTQCLQIGSPAFAGFCLLLSGAHCVGGFLILEDNKMHPLTQRHRVIEYPIKGCEYIDLDGNLWTYNAYVQMTYRFEVRDVILTAVEVENIKGDLLSFPALLSEGMKETLKDHAADLALERVQSVNFESDGVE